MLPSESYAVTDALHLDYNDYKNYFVYIIADETVHFNN